jgi:hypothetical protein
MAAKRDLDPNNTPTIFRYRGRELMAAQEGNAACISWIQNR